jgi:integrase/DNA-binding XRE family transcriptional regulator
MNENQNRPPLGLRVRLAREKLHLSQADLAKLLGFASYKTVGKLEKKHAISAEFQTAAEQWLATVEQPADQLPADKPLHVRLHETRLLKRVPVVRLAKLFGICHETVTGWENGPGHTHGWPIPREWVPLVERWVATGVEPSKEETKLARQQLVVIGSPELADSEDAPWTKPKVKRSPEMTWQRFRRMFELEGTLGLKDRTREDYRLSLDCFDRVAKPKKLKTVTERTITRYAGRMREFGRSPATINHHLRVLRTALMWAHEQRIIAETPRIRMLRTPKKLPRIVNEEEFHRLLAAAPDHRWTALFLTALYTGMRLGELHALEWHDVDFANLRVLLRAEVNKGSRDEWIPLYPGLVPVLEALGRDSERVFMLGYSRINGVCKRVREIAMKAGVRCGMHDLRRSCASWLSAKGVPLQIVQRLLRHSDPRVTMSYYTNVESSLSEAIAKLSPASIEAAGFRVAGKAVPA